MLRAAGREKRQGSGDGKGGERWGRNGYDPGMSPLEICGFLTGAACVLLAMRENILCWPIGMANDVLFFVMFWRSNLYAVCCLQVFYFALSLYGWWRWSHSERGAGRQQIRGTSPGIALGLGMAIPLAWAAVYAMLRHYTDSNVPAGDALATALAMAAQYMTGRKLLENWMVWVAVDAISAGLCVYKHLYLTSLLYAAFIVMCVGGYSAWRKTMRRQAAAE